MQTNRIIYIVFFLLFATSLEAQDFRQAVGVRIGLTAGFEYRVYTDELNSYRFLIGSRESGFMVHGLREFHRYDFFDYTDKIYVVFGAGLHAGFEYWDQEIVTLNKTYHRTHSAFVAGLDGLAALEYKLQELPISLGLEAKPYIDIVGKKMFDFEIFDFAFTAKYHF